MAGLGEKGKRRQGGIVGAIANTGEEGNAADHNTTLQQNNISGHPGLNTPLRREPKVHKHFQIETALNERLLAFAYQRRTKEIRVFKAALDAFLTKEGF